MSEKESRTVSSSDLISSRLVKAALQDGTVVEGWTIFDYFDRAIKTNGWFSVVIWGPKGTGKSNLMLQLLYGVYRDWDKVLERVIYTPVDMARVFREAHQRNKTIKALAFDDMNAFLPRTLYFTNRKVYDRLLSTWNLTRMLMHVFIATVPQKDQVASFVLDDLTAEIRAKGRGVDQNKREYATFDFVIWYSSGDPYNPKRVLYYAIVVQSNVKYYFDAVPPEVWRRYWTRRKEMLNRVMDNWEGALKELDEMITTGEINKPAAPSGEPVLPRYRGIPRAAHFEGID